MIPWVWSHLEVIAGFLLASIIIAHMIRQRHSPSATSAWLLVIVLLPYVGVPLYLLLGGRKMKMVATSKADIKLYDRDVYPMEEAPPMDRLLRSYGIPGANAGNRVHLHATGEEGYAALVELIEGASDDIRIATFILHPDEVGKDIIKRLGRRAAEGVDVRLLLDGVGSFSTGKNALAPLTSKGGRVAFFLPVIHRPFRGRTNLRNHRKIAIADGQRVIAGGTNIASEYIGPTPEEGRWRDLSFLLEGPAVRHYEDVFRMDWAFATGEMLEPRPESGHPVAGDGEGAIVQVVPSGPDVPGDPLYDAILSAAFAAKRRLWFITPYFVPDDALAQALSLSAHRGIDLRILMPARSNHLMADLVRGTYLRDIQEAGGKILLYTKGMVHAKIMLMDDDLAMVGSANIDMRSLYLNYETAMFIYSRPDVVAAESWIQSLAEDTVWGVGEVGFLRDMLEGVMRMLAPLV